MIHRMLIARYRRHVRIARALAGRMPLAARRSVAYPLLQAVGRARPPSRRARAPGLLRFALDTLSLSAAPSGLPVVPGEPPVAKPSGIRFDERELPEIAGEAQTTVIETAADAPLPPAVETGLSEVGTQQQGREALRVSTGETGASPAAVVDMARAWVAQQLCDRTAERSTDRTVAQPEPATDSRPMPSPPPSMPSPPSSPPAEVRVARPPRFTERTPPRRETPPPQPAAPSESGTAPTFDRSPAAWMERLRADARRQSGAAEQSASAMAVEEMPPEIAASSLQEPAGQARDDREHHGGTPEPVLTPDAVRASGEAGQHMPKQQSPHPPADTPVQSPAAALQSTPAALPEGATAPAFAPPSADAPVSPGTVEAGGSAPPADDAAPAFAPLPAALPVSSDAGETGAPAPPADDAAPAFAPLPAALPVSSDAGETGAPAPAEEGAAPAFVPLPAALPVSSDAGETGAPAPTESATAAGFAPPSTGVPEPSRAPEAREPLQVEPVASPESGSAPEFDRSPAAWMERLRTDARRRSEAASQSTPPAAGKGAASLTPESGTQPVQRQTGRRGDQDQEGVAGMHRSTPVPGAPRDNAGQGMALHYLTPSTIPVGASEPIAAHEGNDVPAFDRSPAAWMERLRTDARRRQQQDAEARPSPSAPDRTGTPSVNRPARFVPPLPRTQTPPGFPSGLPVSSGAQPSSPAAASTPVVSESNRRFLRAAVGIDPATVRLLRGQQAGRLTSAYRADAVTIGDDVALAPGRGDETAEGLGLLAHELTHVARRRDPMMVPPIAQPAEQRPGFRPAPPGPATDEEALARIVEAQTVHTARMRFVPPITPGSAGSPATQPVDQPEGAHTAAPVEETPVAPDRGRWGNLPAPWEPLPAWLAPDRTVTDAPVPPVTSPVSATPPQAGTPVVHAAETARTLPSVAPRDTPANEPTPTPAPDIDALARQVYAVLKRRLAAERRRSGW